jgi:hypothetical protein
MVHYRPVLRARQGELDALADVAAVVWERMTPILELVPDDRRTVRDLCCQARDRVAASWRDGMSLVLDAGGVEPDGSLVPGGDVLAELWAEVRPVLTAVTPSVGLRAGRSAAALRAAGALDRGLALRLRAADVALPAGTLRRAVAVLLAAADLAPSDVDLVVDLGPAPADPGAVPGAVGPLLADRAWRSRTLVCGAFPPDLAGLGALELQEFARRDVQTWRAVRASLGPAGTDLDFGDYGVAHPVPAPRAGIAPPQLRYAVGDRWLVVKGHRGRNREFYDVCRQIRDHPEFAAGLGVADEQIDRRGRHGPRSRLRCGNAATWRELSTAHHLEFVVREIG